MSTAIEFYKIYTRQSRSSWADRARVVLTFDAESKQGVYLHLGDFGINGFSISKQLQTLLPNSLQQQYVDVAHIDIVMHIFNKKIEFYCKEHVIESAFKEVFFLNQDAFFSNSTKNQWEMSYHSFIEHSE
ncbi:hypothetical protein A3Q34_08460 [Colwellia sp. PAMC 20917]|uniref:hypothetical protein n=1 Tax=Colwellia sp. PAMC 20917 TaxID=1816218 RepID=UPI0008790AB5|nr:hypothetical protein [Colwellia sp. PAMC 20917]AOW76882.1 hypothetical protein A3Q34_08460 [Colwellia sp. PAMC 20917]